MILQMYNKAGYYIKEIRGNHKFRPLLIDLDDNLDIVGATLIASLLGSFRLVLVKYVIKAHQVSSSEASYRSGDNTHIVSVEDKLQTVL